MAEQHLWVLGGAAVVLVLFVIVTVSMYRRRMDYPYRARPILTRNEHRFYLLLAREAARRKLLVCPKVGLKDLLEVSRQRQYMKYFHRIAQKHVDFVICDRDLRVLFVVELDDSSHDSPEARKRDQFKNRAFKAAGITLKRLRQYDEAAVRDLFVT